MADSKIIIKVQGDTTNINSALKKTDDGLVKTQKSAKKTSESMKKFGLAAAGAFAVMGAAAFKYLQAFAQFDNQMRGVKTLLDANSFGAKGLEKGFKEMTTQVKSLGKRVPVDIGAMNKALFDTVSAGVDASKAVEVLEISAKLAVAGLTDVSTATDGMTSALNAYGLGADEAESVASKFFLAQKRGKTTIAELSNGFGLAASTAKGFGVTLDELLAAVSAASAGAIKTNSAYTGLNAVLANISKPTGEAAKEAKRLGIEFNSIALRSKGLKGFLNQLTQAQGFNAQSAEKLFGSMEAVKLVMALTGSQAKLFEGTLEELGDKQAALNTLSAAYGVQAEGVKSKMDILSNRVKFLAIGIGEDLAPVLLSSIKLFDAFGKGLVDAFLPDKPKTFQDLGRELHSIQRTVKQLKEETSGTSFFGTSSVALIKLAKIEEFEKRILKLQQLRKNITEREEESDAEQAVIDAKIKAVAELKAVKDSEAAEDIRRAEATTLAIAEGKALEFDNELAKTQENAEILNEQGLLNLQEQMAKEAELKEIENAQKLKAEGKHLEAMLKLKAIQDKKSLKAAKARQALDKTFAQQKVALEANTIDLITTVLGKGSKASFVIQKAAALAQIVVARSKALALIPAQTAHIPFPLNIPPAAQLAASINLNAGIQAATIAASAISGFQDGGIVPGSSFAGDNVPARVNSGEMILNTAQQAELFNLAQGGGSTSGTEIVLSLKDGLVDFIEAEIIERRSLGEATI